MSVIETPPRDRLSIQTQVVKFDADVIGAGHPDGAGARRPGVLRAQPRRVDSFRWRAWSARLVPEATLAIGHGQMGEEELENA